MYDFTKLSEYEIINLIKEDLYLGEIPEEYRTEAICLEAVKLDWVDLKYVKNQTIEMQLEALNQSGFALQFIENPTLKVQIEAIKKRGFALEFIKNPTEEMKFIAVKNNGYALKLIKDQTIELCVEAIKNKSWAIEYVNDNLLEKVLEQLPNIKFLKCKRRNLLCEFLNNEWLFSIGCQDRITKEQFIDRIYNNGGLERNPHRAEYLEILEQF